MDLTYIVTETKGPDSFDPLNADKTQNISVMRMLFSTPLEVDSKNTLQSRLLSSFRYNREDNEILFEVREGQTYSDGSLITADDVALAIARTAYFWPKFPVIKDIEGVDSWIASQRGLRDLPKGISVTGNRISIKLVKENFNQLFRFCLELFSVVPSSCIDRDTGKMNCLQAPSSGYFSMRSKTGDEIVFDRRNGQYMVEPIQFESIKFRFSSLKDACRTDLKENEIISGVEIDFISSNCKTHLTPSQIHWMPSSRFSVLRFNPNVKPFDQSLARRFFAERVRKVLRKENSDLLVERGLFSRLLPGYLSNTELDHEFPDGLSSLFEGKRILLPKIASSGLGIVFNVVVKAAEDLGMQISYIDEPSNDDLVRLFIEGKIPVIVGASGFWAQDPVGDISMWFTPDLHKTMHFAWQDAEIYRQIDGLERQLDASQVSAKLSMFNRYISEQSVLMPVLHFRRLFISSKNSSSLHLPQAVTSPAPWQLISSN